MLVLVGTYPPFFSKERTAAVTVSWLADDEMRATANSPMDLVRVLINLANVYAKRQDVRPSGFWLQMPQTTPGRTRPPSVLQDHPGHTQVP